MPLNPPSSDSGIQTLTDYLVAVIHDRDYEGLVAKGVEAKAVSRVVIPRLGDRKTHIILQVRRNKSAIDSFTVLTYRLTGYNTTIWLTSLVPIG